MRLLASIGVLALFSALPFFLRRSARLVSPRQRIILSISTLLGMAFGFFALLGATVAPAGVGIPNALRAVEICLVAGTQLFQHPLRHWPSITAALLLIVFGARLLIGLVASLRDARRARPRGQQAGDPMMLLAAEEPLAYTVGLLRPRVVVTTGLQELLAPDELRAVIAHENAHARGGHVPLLFVARVVDRAFGRFPPARLASHQLTGALEVRADERAIDEVGDRLIVMRAIERVVTQRSRQLALGMGSEDPSERIDALLRPLRPLAGGKVGAVLVGAVLLVTVGTQALAWTSGTDAIAHESIAARLHKACHLPHD